MDNHTHSLGTNPESSLSREETKSRIPGADRQHTYVQRGLIVNNGELHNIRIHRLGRTIQPVNSSRQLKVRHLAFILVLFAWRLHKRTRPKFAITWRGQQMKRSRKATDDTRFQTNSSVTFGHMQSRSFKGSPDSFFKTCSSVTSLGRLSHSALPKSVHRFWRLFRPGDYEDQERTFRWPERSTRSSRFYWTSLQNPKQISSISRCSLKASDAEFAIDDSSKKPRPCQLTDDDIVKNFGKCFSYLI